MDEDLNYTLQCSTKQSEKVKCAINSSSGGTVINGTIKKETHKVVLNIMVVPITQLKVGDKIEISVIADTKLPYEKQISAKFSITVSNQDANFKIEDNVNQNYAIVEIVNSQPSSTQIAFEFDPTIVRLDLNDEIYINNVKYETTKIDSKDFISKIYFVLEKESVRHIKFYKVDKSKDYTYPSGTKESVIKLINN